MSTDPTEQPQDQPAVPAETIRRWEGAESRTARAPGQRFPAHHLSTMERPCSGSGLPTVLERVYEPPKCPGNRTDGCKLPIPQQCLSTVCSCYVGCRNPRCRRCYRKRREIPPPLPANPAAVAAAEWRRIEWLARCEDYDIEKDRHEEDVRIVTEERKNLARKWVAEENRLIEQHGKEEGCRLAHENRLAETRRLAVEAREEEELRLAEEHRLEQAVTPSRSEEGRSEASARSQGSAGALRSQATGAGPSMGAEAGPSQERPGGTLARKLSMKNLQEHDASFGHTVDVPKIPVATASRTSSLKSLDDGREAMDQFARMRGGVGLAASRASMESSRRSLDSSGRGAARPRRSLEESRRIADRVEGLRAPSLPILDRGSMRSSRQGASQRSRGEPSVKSLSESSTKTGPGLSRLGPGSSPPTSKRTSPGSSAGSSPKSGPGSTTRPEGGSFPRPLQAAPAQLSTVYSQSLALAPAKLSSSESGSPPSKDAAARPSQTLQEARPSLGSRGDSSTSRATQPSGSGAAPSPKPTAAPPAPGATPSRRPATRPPTTPSAGAPVGSGGASEIMAAEESSGSRPRPSQQSGARPSTTTPAGSSSGSRGGDCSPRPGAGCFGSGARRSRSGGSGAGSSSGTGPFSRRPTRPSMAPAAGLSSTPAESEPTVRLGGESARNRKKASCNLG